MKTFFSLALVLTMALFASVNSQNLRSASSDEVDEVATPVESVDSNHGERELLTLTFNGRRIAAARAKRGNTARQEQAARERQEAAKHRAEEERKKMLAIEAGRNGALAKELAALEAKRKAEAEAQAAADALALEEKRLKDKEEAEAEALKRAEAEELEADLAAEEAARQAKMAEEEEKEAEKTAAEGGDKGPGEAGDKLIIVDGVEYVCKAVA